MGFWDSLEDTGCCGIAERGIASGECLVENQTMICSMLFKPLSRIAALAALAVLVCPSTTAQQSPPENWTADQDHKNMMDQLGIKALRPGPSGTETAPNHANYDEAAANPFPNLPDVLTMKDGRKVTTPAMWTERRREIVEDFDREVLGRVPANVPKVTWTVTRTVDATVGGHAIVGKQLVGHVDNAAYPA